MLRYTILAAGAGLLIGCHVPVLRDDFTQMPNDVFTETTLRIYQHAYAPELDMALGHDIAQRFFKHPSQAALINYFQSNGGQCVMGGADEKNKMLCQVTRSWHYRSVGYFNSPYDKCVPHLLLVYNFIYENSIPDTAFWRLQSFNATQEDRCTPQY